MSDRILDIEQFRLPCGGYGTCHFCSKFHVSNRMRMCMADRKEEYAPGNGTPSRGDVLAYSIGGHIRMGKVMEVGEHYILVLRERKVPALLLGLVALKPVHDVIGTDDRSWTVIREEG